MILTDRQWDVVDRIDGWLWRDEADLLYRLARPPWCELGSWRGRSTHVLGYTGHGYAVDTWNGSREHNAEQTTGVYSDWQRNTRRLHVTPLRGDYRKMAHLVPGELTLLFIDHEHTYRAVVDAFDLYAPKVRSGGHIVIHDGVGDDDWWPEVRIAANHVSDDPFVVRRADVGRCAVFVCQ